MQGTPQSNRKHIALYGQTNSGKSSLFNAIINQEAAIVSPIAGTTTDPLTKSIELTPFGPVTIIDTGGLGDSTQIGKERIRKTYNTLERTDLAVYAIDIKDFDENAYDNMKQKFQKREIPYITVATKKDLYTFNEFSEFSKKYNLEMICVSVNNTETITQLKDKIIEVLSRQQKSDETLVGDLLEKGSVVLLVVPIDSEAPKGRLILPQVQVLRDCLDNDITAIVTTEKTLEQAIKNARKIDLVITDSQAFKIVSEIIPDSMKLTSFSILMARQKGDIKKLIEGVYQIENLKQGDNILIAESCTHNHTHEDIGRIKIPAMLKKHTGCELNFDFVSGKDFPEDLKKYSLIIHCGGCMMTRKELCNRINYSNEENTAITNYGVVLSYINGILNRSIEIL